MDPGRCRPSTPLGLLQRHRRNRQKFRWQAESGANASDLFSIRVAWQAPGMWLTVSAPVFNVSAPAIRVARVHACDGERLSRGQSLLDLTIDLSAGLDRDCPPVSTCRIVLREDAWLRRLCVRPGDEVSPGETLALLSIEAESPPAASARKARVTVATVLHQADWWAAGP